MGLGVSWVASLSLSLWVPSQGLTCDARHWHSEGVSNPSPASLEDFIFFWLLLAPFPDFSLLLLMVSGHRIRRILLLQLLMNFWNFFGVAAVVLRVSAPYSRIGFTVVSKILILMLMPRLDEAQMCFFLMKAAVALPILTFTSASAPPLVCQQCYLGRCLPIHLPPVVCGLCWLLRCSWGPCSYPCGPSDEDALNYPQPCWSSLVRDGWLCKEDDRKEVLCGE